MLPRPSSSACAVCRNVLRVCFVCLRERERDAPPGVAEKDEVGVLCAC